MASRPWTQPDRDFLEKMTDRRDWFELAVKRFPHRSEAAIRCMMQKIRAEMGMGDKRTVDAPWMADAIMGSRRLYERLLETGLRP